MTARIAEPYSYLSRKASALKCAKIGQCIVQCVVIPIPPGKCLKSFGYGFWMAALDKLRGNATNNCIGCNILGYHRMGGNDGAIADGDAFHDDRAMTYPGIVPNGYRP